MLTINLNTVLIIAAISMLFMFIQSGKESESEPEYEPKIQYIYTSPRWYHDYYGDYYPRYYPRYRRHHWRHHH